MSGGRQSKYVKRIGLLVGVSIAALGVTGVAVATNQDSLPHSGSAKATVSEPVAQPSEQSATTENNDAVAPQASSDETGSNNSSHTSVRINGTTVSNSNQGSVHKVITTTDGQASVDVSTHSSQSGEGSSNTSKTTVNITTQ